MDRIARKLILAASYQQRVLWQMLTLLCLSLFNYTTLGNDLGDLSF